MSAEKKNICPRCGGLMGWIVSIRSNPPSIRTGWRCCKCDSHKKPPRRAAITAQRAMGARSLAEVQLKEG